MKRTLLIFIIALYSLSGMSAPHGKFGKNLAWHYDVKTQTLYVTGTGELPYCIWGEKTKNHPIEGKRYSFKTPYLIRGKWKWEVKNVCLSEGITSIGEDVFRSCDIEDFTMPASLESGRYAFYYCSIDRLHYKGTLEQWLNGRIAERCLQSTRRVDRVFVGEQELGGKIAIPHTVSHIPAYALSYKVITSLTLPSTVTSVNKYAFEGSKIDTVQFIGTLDEWCTRDYSPITIYRHGPLLIQGQPVSAELSLNDTITRIGNYAFYNQTQLNSIQFPASIQTIGDSAFSGTGLQRIDLPMSLQNIGEGAFGRTGIYRVTWRIPQYDGNKDIFNKRKVNYFTFTETVRRIPDSICQNMVSLWNLKIENGVTHIGNHAFENCGMEQVILPQSVKNIGVKAFYDSYKIRLVTIPNRSCVIQSAAFTGCNRLTRQPQAGITVDDSRQKENLPAMRVYDADSNYVNISPKLQDGHMTMLLFDATWCYPSRQLLKYVEAHWDEWTNRYPDLQLLLVLSHDSSKRKQVSFGEQYWDAKEGKVLYKVFDANSYPYMVFYDKYGKKIGYILGNHPELIEKGLKKTYDSK